MASDREARRASCTCDCHTVVLIARPCGLVFQHASHDTHVRPGQRDYPEVDVIRCHGTPEEISNE